MTQETAVQDIKNRHKSSIANEKIEKFTRQEMNGEYTGTMKDH